MRKLFYKAIILNFFVVCTLFAGSHYEDKAPRGLANHLHKSHSKELVDKGWLADLTGLPDKAEIAKLGRHVTEVMKEDDDRRCTSINWHLRHMIFVHFVIYQYMANNQSIYLDEKTVRHWAHVFGMILKESSGDSTSITSMTGRSMSTYQAKTNLEHWKRITTLKKHGRIPLNEQTNFGLTQLSADRLRLAFHIAREPRDDISFLEGKEGAETQDEIRLDTAIAIRRLIWFYQDFAQGRITQSDMRIHKQDIDNPEYSERYPLGLEMALLYCGTYFMFSEGHHEDEIGIAALKDAMASIAYCKLGNAHSGYGHHEMDERCFAKWVTLCPSLNFDIAMLTPMSYFATRDSHPVCEGMFKRLLIKKGEVPKEKPAAKAKETNKSKPKKQKEAKFGLGVKKLLNAASNLVSNIFSRSN